MLDGLLTREWDAGLDALCHLVLPALALATIPLAVIVRITRARVLDVLDEDYVRTAEAKGLTPGVIRSRHVLRNALLPVSTTIGLQTGAAARRRGAHRDGLRLRRHRHAPRRGDRRAGLSACCMGFILLIALVYVLVNLLVDLSYALIDPRVRVR